MKRLLFTVLFLAAGFPAVFAQNEAQTVAMVEVIRKEPITVRQLKAKLTPLEQARGRPATAAERRTFLDDFVNQRLILQAAERDKTAVSEGEIEAALRDYLSQQNGGRPLTDAEYAQAMGANAAMIRQDAREQLLIQKYVMSKKQAQINNEVQRPTDEDILAWFNLNKAQLVRPDTVCLNTISVPYGADSAAKAKAKEIADRLARDLAGNASKFDEAVLKGQPTDNRVPGVGYVSSRGFYMSRTPEFQRAVGERFLTIAFSLKQGDISPLIENDLVQAYQLIKVTEVYPQKSLEIDDIIDPANPRIMTVRQYIGQGILTERSQRAMDKALGELISDLRKSRNAVTIYEQYLNW
jgi:hypothetical protein